MTCGFNNKWYLYLLVNPTCHFLQIGSTSGTGILIVNPHAFSITGLVL